MPNNSFDSSNVEKALRDLIDRQFPEIITRALGKVGAAIIHDANMEVPATPLKFGYLRSSASAFVNNEHVYTAPWIVKERGDKEYFPTTDHTEAIPPNVQQVVVGWNTPYAAAQHEGTNGVVVFQNYTTEGTSKKFLERKLQENDQLYVKLVADEIKASGNA